MDAKTVEALEQMARSALEQGITLHQLKCWGVGKMIGGPDINLAEAPKFCALLADVIEKREINL